MADLKLLKTLISVAKRNKIKRLKFDNIEFEIIEHGLVSASEKKQIKKLLTATPRSDQERLKEYESDLFYSA